MTQPEAVRIGWLSVRAGVLSDAEARRLAELIGLAVGRRFPLRSAQDVNVALPDQTGRSVDQIADAVAHAIADALCAEGVQ
jgi:hypothetical protein